MATSRSPASPTVPSGRADSSAMAAVTALPPTRPLDPDAFTPVLAAYVGPSDRPCAGAAVELSALFEFSRTSSPVTVSFIDRDSLEVLGTVEAPTNEAYLLELTADRPGIHRVRAYYDGDQETGSRTS